MEQVLFISAWFIVPFFWFYILNLGGMRIMFLSLPSFVVISIFIFQYVGFPILYFGLDEYRAEFVTDKVLIYKAWLGTSISTLLICIGASLGSFLLKPLGYFKVLDRIELLQHKYIKKRVYVVSFFCVGILFYYISKVGWENIALVAVLNGASISEIAIARSLMGNDFGSGYHWYNFFMRNCLVFTLLILISIQLHRVENVSRGYIYFILLATILSLLMATEKGLVVDFLMAISFVYILSKRKGVVPVFVIFYFLFFVFLILIIFYIYFMGDLNISAGIWSIFSRGLTGSLQPIYHYLEFFPLHQNWLYGSSFPNPGGILPFTPYNLTVELMNFVQPEHYNSGVVGTMPAIYWGELFANFGYIGVLIISPFVGLVLYFINWFIYRLNFNPLNTALFAWLLVHYKNLSLTSLSMFVIDFNLFLIIVTYLIIKIRIINKFKNKSLQ
jgi:oligosaccharide repeat unit polymerase